MSFDVFERLRDTEVPEIPSDIDERIHQRVNTSLTANHIVDFFCGALPHAVSEFAKPLGELLIVSFGGKQQPPRRRS